MKEKKIQIKFQTFDSKDELSIKEQTLLNKAWEASENAYAPYSHFRVGAALLLENGEIVIGNNQENAAYPSGLCAERVALFAASANYPGIAVLSVAIVAKPEQFELVEPVTPCGSCRQVIAEYEFIQEKSIDLIMSTANGKIIKSTGIGNLLPLAFYNEQLKKEK